MKRRDFLQMMAGGAVAASLPGASLSVVERTGGRRPNILWISVEDMSPDLGCYGDKYAVSPTIDGLAEEGVRYTNVFSHSGVCAPTRSGIITGMYPTTIGTHHMRCQGVPQPSVKCFPEYLRAAGYYCTNNSKTDYQFDSPDTAWDENGRQAHWRGRSEGQPFFAVFNLTTTHESQIRNFSTGMQNRIGRLGSDEKHDPAAAVLPPYYPDTPLVRRDWAQYYDIITLMDKEVGGILNELEQDGLAEDTIVWFWADHGRGLPRAKRWIYDSGLHVPLIIRVPEKFGSWAMPARPESVRPGSVMDDLVAFIDFAPTMLSLAGVKIPDVIQGRAFLGEQKAAPRKYVFAARDRMDEAYDLIRAVRDKRYKYIRNYMPHLTYGQDIDYMNQMPTMQEMRRLHAEGKLVGPQKQYFQERKPIEELYDTQSDPHEVVNAAGDPRYKEILERMRGVHRDWVRRTGDIGLIPEPEFDELKRPGGKWRKTEPPCFTGVAGGGSPGEIRVTLSCATPGASIAYAVGKSEKPRWKLYSRPLRLKAGSVLLAKACRLGYRDSVVKEFAVSAGEVGDDQPRSVEEIKHWRERVDATDLLDRLRRLKALDPFAAAAIPKYHEALKDPDGSVRYWGVIGLHNNCKEPAAIDKASESVGKLLADPSPVVRIASAHALCDWGLEKQALPVLIEGLKDSSDTVRLHAAIALGRIGEKARPALPQLRAAMKDSFGYVVRVTGYTLRRLEGAGEEKEIGAGA